MSLPDPDPSFEALIDYLGRTRGFDFSGYKRPTLIRRVQKRLAELGLTTFTEYVDYLEVHADEFELLFNTILINVTGFFRDPKAWDYLAESVVPRILENADAGPIRIWSAGCASGEEAYTLAILFAEAMGEQEFRARVKIYATDVDEQALAQARAGTFAPKVLDGVPDAFRDRYFVDSGPDCSFRADLRRSVIFGRHDLPGTRPSRVWTSWSVATRSCTSTPRRKPRSCAGCTSPSVRAATSSSAERRCCSPTATCSNR